MQLARTLLVVVAAVAALPVHAQSVSPAWDAYRAGQQPEATATPARTEHRDTGPASSTVEPANLPTVDTARETTPIARTTSAAYAAPTGDASRGAFFVAAQAGQAWIYDDVRQDAKAISAGYRWQAGPFVQVGIEGVAGRIDSGDMRNFGVDDTDYASLGANARFQFGHNPVFAVARLGYWRADEGSDIGSEIVDGGYAGLGLGLDFSRHLNLTLAYSLHAYASSYCNRSACGTEINRADLVTLGLEARF